MKEAKSKTERQNKTKQNNSEKTINKIGDNLIRIYADVNGLVEGKAEKERLMKKS